MWVMRGGPPSYIGLLYFYSETRSSEVARELLNGYRGIVQSDGYQGYGYLDEKEEVEHAGCWAHARRKFMEALKAVGNVSKKKNGKNPRPMLPSNSFNVSMS